LAFIASGLKLMYAVLNSKAFPVRSWIDCDVARRERLPEI